MTGYHTADGFVNGPMDDRDADDPEFTVDPELSQMCSPGDEYDPFGESDGPFIHGGAVIQ